MMPSFEEIMNEAARAIGGTDLRPPWRCRICNSTEWCDTCRMLGYRHVTTPETIYCDRDRLVQPDYD